MKILPLLLAALALLGTARAADENTTTIKFSDPGKTGTVKIAVARGDITIRGADVPDVRVKTEAVPQQPAVRKDGLRVLTVTSSYSLTEKDNVVTLDALADGWMGGEPSNFDVTVPKNANVVVTNAFGGDVRCGGITGDINVKSLNGEVRINDLVGGASVETTNGEIHATVRDLHENKPVSFTSMNGAVVLKVRADAKANVRLRTQNGTILTDFDESALATKVESLPGGNSRDRRVLTAEMRRAFQEAGRASAEAAKRAAEAIHEAAEAARQGVEGATEDGDATARPMPRAHPIPAMPPMPPIPAIPAMTGGKLVSGTLNGGGPEINVATMNGDITLRKL
ncbi:MAG TPA: DUF4097 family beta strand repeat-containing protein [Opitutaceae bacterium]|nr:DUF4097 family beta strand repeat-containing protein [Opitutaceae bacterium]